MIEKNEQIKSVCDNLLLATTIFIPEKECVGIVQISHGMTEHKERYFDFMKYLTKQGYITIINDHRGHGKSFKNARDLGYFYDNSANYVVEDLHQVTLFIKKKYPHLPITLFGHSMGSMIVMKYLQKYHSDIDKVILCGLPSKNNQARIGLLLAKFLSSLKGDHYRSSFLQNITFSNYNKKFPSLDSPYAWLSSNKEILETYENDSLCGFIFTTNGFQNLFKLNIDIYNKKEWPVTDYHTSLYLIAGSDDPVIISKDKWLQSGTFLKNIGFKKVSHKLYPNLRHELLNEKNNERIYQDIINFINTKL